jgi:transcriptional regulator with XRE-family HTH domain
MAALNVRELGEYIREQRANAEISLRQLSRLAGVSNPYLSQIERGLRRPSAEILQQIARALRISAEALYVQAGILEERPADSEVPAAILTDVTITERQKQVLLEIYDSFRRENEGTAATAGQAPTGQAGQAPTGQAGQAPTGQADAPTARGPAAPASPLDAAGVPAPQAGRRRPTGTTARPRRPRKPGAADEAAVPPRH